MLSTPRPRVFRERIDLPIATLVALAGMLATVAVVAIRFIQIAALGTVEAPLAVRIAVTVAATIMFAAVPFAAAWSLRRGWPFAPQLVTFVGAVGALQIPGYADVLGLVAERSEGSTKQGCQSGGSGFRDDQNSRGRDFACSRSYDPSGPQQFKARYLSR